jgi:hypothetical protein
MGESRTTPVSTFLSTLYMEPKAEFRRVDTRSFALAVKGLEGQATSTPPADIVLFLQESQFNPRSIQGCPESLCSLRGFGASPQTSDHGQLKSHVYGGGTWLSEFALATGLPHELFGPAGAFASFNVAPGIRQSFIRSLKAAGYYTVAVYPVRGGMMNARSAYRAYGFDAFLDADELGLSGQFRTSDRLVHAAALKVLASARQHGKPVFLFAVTIFNHADHGIAMDEVDPATFAAAQAFSKEPAEWRNLADYVWRTREFEKSMDATRQEVLGSTRPAVVAWFGDHQPPFANAPALRNAIKAFPAQPQVPDKYITWFDIETNLGTPLARSPPAVTDIVFLPGLLAQRAGVPLDPWLGANVLARQKCGSLLMECPDSGWRDAYLTYLLDDLKEVE